MQAGDEIAMLCHWIAVCSPIYCISWCAAQVKSGVELVKIKR